MQKTIRMIWQTVWLDCVASTYINKIRWTPNFDGFEIGCDTTIAGDLKGDHTIKLKIFHHGKLLADDHYKVIGNEASRKINLSEPGIDDSRNELLWSHERPTLLDAEIYLKRYII